ncbi:MAG TPA: CbiQ family ECF transporter T component, partial [Candidatus Thermoplasmatota archaeon]|nr:CbiQ family ECF transporter T component [Candidatus Thermoplasmatota archaeon]
LALNALLVALFVPGEPLLAFGPVAASREGLAAGALAGLRLLAVVIAAQFFLATTPPRGLLDLAGRWPALAVGLGASLSAIPAAEDDARRLARAARSRGLAPGPRTWARLAAPLAVATARRGRVLGDALAAAGWEGRRAVYGRRRWGAPEALAVALGVSAIALAVAQKL